MDNVVAEHGNEVGEHAICRGTDAAGRKFRVQIGDNALAVYSEPIKKD